MSDGTVRIVGMVLLGMVGMSAIVGSTVLAMSGRPSDPTLTAAASATIGGLLALIPTESSRKPDNGKTT